MRFFNRKNNTHFLKHILAFLTVLVFITNSYLPAQPRDIFSRIYPDGRTFWDVYIDDEQNIMLAGSENWVRPNPDPEGPDNLRGWFFRVVKVNPDDGSPIWDCVYPDEGELPPLNTKAVTLIQTDDGNYSFGGVWAVRGSSNGSFTIAKVSNDGEQIWLRFYGELWSSAICNALIETKDGVLLGCGQSDGIPYATMINSEDGEPIWERYYGNNIIPNGRHFAGLREVPDEGFLMAAFGGQGTVLIMIDDDGEVIWTRNYDNGVPYALISVRAGGFATCGHCGGFREGVSDFIMMKFNREGFRDWWNHYATGTQSYGIVQDRSGGFVLAGSNVPGRDGVIVKTDPAGNFEWGVTENDEDNPRTRQYNSITTRDGMNFYIAGYHDFDAYLKKIFIAPREPVIVDFGPENRVITLLRGDEQTFWVYAEGPENDDLTYFWTANGEEVSQDSFAVVQFPEMDTVLVKCVVHNEQDADSVEWRVLVEELYISEQHPISPIVQLRRGQEQQFSIVVRATEGEEPVEKVWELDGEPIGEGDTLLYRFNFPHEHSLIAVASRGEYADTARWQVDVKSVISRWRPVGDSLTIFQNDGIEFWVAPFNPESDSLTYLWTLDGDSVWNDRLWFHQFPDPGEYGVGVRLFDGAEGDSVFWTVDVQGLEAVDHGQDARATRFELYPAYPNPFNSTAVTSYELRVASQISLGLYDTRGRLVKLLDGGWRDAGQHRVTIDATDLPAGVYVIRFESVDRQGLLSYQARKAVVVK